MDRRPFTMAAVLTMSWVVAAVKVDWPATLGRRLEFGQSISTRLAAAPCQCRSFARRNFQDVGHQVPSDGDDDSFFELVQLMFSIVFVAFASYLEMSDIFVCFSGICCYVPIACSSLARPTSRPHSVAPRRRRPSDFCPPANRNRRLSRR